MAKNPFWSFFYVYDAKYLLYTSIYYFLIPFSFFVIVCLCQFLSNKVMTYAVCMFSRIYTWYWVTVWCTVLSGRLFLQLSEFLFDSAWRLVSFPISMLACLLVFSSSANVKATVIVTSLACSFFDSSRRHNVIANLLFIWLLKYSCPLLLSGACTLVPDLCWLCVSWTEHHNSAFCLTVVFCNNLHCLDEKWVLCLSGYIFRMQLEIFWFSKVVVVASPSRSVTLLVLGKLDCFPVLG